MLRVAGRCQAKFLLSLHNFEKTPLYPNECTSKSRPTLKMPDRLLILLHPDQLDPMRLSALLGG